MTNILIIEDDIVFSQILTSFLRKNGYNTVVASGIKEANITIKEQRFNLVLLDYRLPDGIGLDLLPALHVSNHLAPVIIMTSFHDVKTAVKAMRSGAYDYITKPINPDELLMVIHEALKRETSKPTAQSTQPPKFVEGTSEASRQIHNYVQLVAPTDMSVIIQGESGTGKEQVAQTIHRLSKRNGGAFVAIDCGALSADLAGSELFGHIKGAFTGALQNKKGQFEAANGGTLFLDEVGNLSYEIQVKLLRALQEHEIQPIGSNQIIKVDVRIITATNDDLLSAVKNGKFREDLYHRLNEFKIQLPPLHERIEDMNLFIAYFIQQANSELNKQVSGVSEEVQVLFRQYEWPGNLRELKNIIKRAVLLAKEDIITLNDLPLEMSATITQANAPQKLGPDLKAVKAANEKELIIKTLQEAKFNKSKTARMLNIDRTTLYYKMVKYNIDM